MSIPALEANVEEIDRQIARLECELEAKRLERKLTVNAIAAARLQAWYAANPGIELRVGDELAVTNDVKLLLNGWKGVVIEDIYLHWYNNEPLVAICSSHGDDEEVSIDTARRMREAWLAQEAQS